MTRTRPCGSTKAAKRGRDYGARSIARADVRKYPEKWRIWEEELLAPILSGDPDVIRFTAYEELSLSALRAPRRSAIRRAGHNPRPPDGAHVGDRLADETGEWKVISRPRMSPGAPCTSPGALRAPNPTTGVPS